MSFIDFIYIFILTIIPCLSIVLIFILVINPYLKEKNNIKKIAEENRKLELYSNINPQVANDNINKYIKEYIDKYALVNFTLKKIDYIKQDLTNEMVNKITLDVVINLSDVYLYYIKILTPINNDKDLIKFIRNKVKFQVLDYVTEYNRF